MTGGDGLVPTPPDADGAALPPGPPPTRGLAAETLRLLAWAAAVAALAAGASRFGRAVARDVGMGEVSVRLEALPLLLAGLATGLLLRLRADVGARLRALAAAAAGAAAGLAAVGHDPRAGATRLGVVVVAAALAAFTRHGPARRR